MLDQSNGSRQGAARSDSKLFHDLPLVSVIVTSYNYDAFITQAITSVMQQTYPFIECIIIDDRSTDGTLSVLQGLKETYPQIEYYINEQNMGQSGSSVAGLRKSTGDYIVFLDADDYLLPTCIETHIQAHLSLRIPVGFTSVDLLQVRDGRVVTTGSPYFSIFFNGAERRPNELVRDLDSTFQFSKEAMSHSELRDALCYVHPAKSDSWPWSPTSGNCFRREALVLIMENERLPSLRSCTDCYMLHGVACLAGSALIDRSLVAYRLHGRNDFAKGATLNRIRSYDLDYLELRSAEAMIMLVDYIMDNAEAFSKQYEVRWFYRETLETLDVVYPPICTTGFSYVTRKLLLNRTMLRKVLGEEDYDNWIMSRCAPERWRHTLTWVQTARRLFNTHYVPRLIEEARRQEAKRLSDVARRG